MSWEFKISVAFGAVSDAWDKSELYYQKIVAFIDQINVILVLFMFKKTNVPENMLITFNHIFVACSVLVLVHLEHNYFLVVLSRPSLFCFHCLHL